MNDGFARTQLDMLESSGTVSIKEPWQTPNKKS
jgi:hypothetical protein